MIGGREETPGVGVKENYEQSSKAYDFLFKFWNHVDHPRIDMFRMEHVMAMSQYVYWGSH